MDCYYTIKLSVLSLVSYVDKIHEVYIKKMLTLTTKLFIIYINMYRNKYTRKRERGLHFKKDSILVPAPRIIKRKINETFDWLKFI